MNRNVLYGVGCLMTICAAAALSSAAAAQAQGSESSKAISGTVLEGTQHAPVGGATVQLLLRSGGRVVQSATATTDQAGRFSLGGLQSAEEFSLRAHKQGYADGEFGQQTEEGQGRTFNVLAGGWPRDIKVPLWRQASLAGTVLDEADRPIGGATVRVLREIRVASTRRFAAGPAATTDDLGTYRVAGLAAGRYLLQVVSIPVRPASSTSAVATYRPSAPDSTRSGSAAFNMIYPPTFFPGASVPEGALPIDVAAGSLRQGMDFKLSPAKAFPLSGRLEIPPEGFSGAFVRLTPTGGGATSGLWSVAITRADRTGVFSFREVPAGSYVIQALPALSEVTWGEALTESETFSGPIGRGPAMRRAVAANVAGADLSTRGIAGAGAGFWGQQTVEIGAGRPEGNASVLVHVQPAMHIRGKVEVEAPQPGSAELPRGRGSATGPIVVAEPADGAQLDWAPPQSSLSDSSGAFDIGGLLPGRYVLRIASGATIKSALLNGTDYSRRPLVISDGGDLGSVIITVTSKVSSVAGTVSDERGAVAGIASVLVFPTSSSEWVDYGLTPVRIRTAEANSNGIFRVNDLPAGDYYILATSGVTVPWQDPDYLTRAAGLATRVSVGWGDSKTVGLTVRLIK